MLPNQCLGSLCWPSSQGRNRHGGISSELAILRYHMADRAPGGSVETRLFPEREDSDDFRCHDCRGCASSQSDAYHGKRARLSNERIAHLSVVVSAIDHSLQASRRASERWIRTRK